MKDQLGLQDPQRNQGHRDHCVGPRGVPPALFGARLRPRALAEDEKGIATVELADGIICEAGIHWYEAHGIGRKDFRIKRVIR